MKNFMVFAAGLALGGGAMIFALPLPQESEKCGVSKVRTEIETAYVLKSPEPQKCLPTVVQVPVNKCEEKPAPVAEPEPQRRPRKHRRGHRRHRAVF